MVDFALFVVAPSMVVIGAVFVFLYWLLQKKRYNIICLIFSERAGGGFSIKVDRMGIFNDKKRMTTFGKFKNKKLRRFDQGQLGNVIDSGNKKYMFWYQKTPTDVRPMTFDILNKNFQVIDENMKMAHAFAVEDAYTTFDKRSMLIQYLPVISVIIVTLAMVLLMFGMNTYLGDIFSQLATISDKLVQALDTVENVPTAIPPL